MTAYTDARALELLLSVIFTPHNSYCIHIDPKVSQCSKCLCVAGCKSWHTTRALYTLTSRLPFVFLWHLAESPVTPNVNPTHTQITRQSESQVMSKECWVQAEPDFLATVQNILECYRLRFPDTHIQQSSRFDLQKTNFYLALIFEYKSIPEGTSCDLTNDFILHLYLMN